MLFYFKRYKFLLSILFFILLLCLFYEKFFFFYLSFLTVFSLDNYFVEVQSLFIFFFKKILLTFIFILLSLFKILCIFIAVAFFTVAERKVLGAIHRRRGPSLVGFWGLLQPIADALKLFIKELILPLKASRFIFLIAPSWILLLSVFGWVIIPFSSSLIQKNNVPFNYIHDEDFFNNSTLFINYIDFFSIDIKNGILFLLAISSLNVYGIILAGWSSNSKYAFLGSLRSSAQMISYEVSLGLTLLPVVILSNSLNFTDIVFFQKSTCFLLFPLLPCFIIFLVSMLAETNRTPFDLPEAEAELVAGYNVEYSAITFAMFFLGEYSSMILMACFGILLFLGGWSVNSVLVFSLKIVVLCFFFILVRATFPRFRYDQLMQICWKIFLPVSLSFFIFVASFIFFFLQR